MIGENKRQKIAIYVRVSSQEQAVEGVSIEAQTAALRAYAKSQGWEIAEEYVDRGFSGGTDDRPALKRLLADAGYHRFSIVAVCKLDRFFRNLRLLLNHLHGLEELGIKFVSTQEGLDTSTPYGKFAVQIMGVIAEFERDRIGERVRDSRRYLVSKGNWPGGRSTYGYHWLSKERKWEIVPAEAAIVQHVYDLYTKKKLSINAIVAALKKEDIHTRDGADWRYSKVREMLVHPGYKGQHPIGIPMPVIIDENMWQNAQIRREGARTILADPRGWLLQGLCSCGECGHILKCLQKKRSEYRYYACRGRVDRNSPEQKHCKLPYVRADWLEHGVSEKVKEVLNDSGKLVESINQSLIELEKRRREIGTKSLAVESKIEQVRIKEERLGMAFADGAVSESAYRTKLKRLKKEEADLLKCQRNFDPRELAEIVSLGISIEMVKDVLSKGTHGLGEYDILSQVDEIMNSLDAKFLSGKYADKDTDDIKTTNLSGDKSSLQENPATTLRNQRSLLQKFNIRVVVYPNRVEIKGAIPTQILDKTDKEKTARIICSPSLRGEGGRNFLEGLSPLGNAPPTAVVASSQDSV